MTQQAGAPSRRGAALFSTANEVLEQEDRRSSCAPCGHTSSKSTRVRRETDRDIDEKDGTEREWGYRMSTRAMASDKSALVMRPCW
jgi:hypothetical protein